MNRMKLTSLNVWFGNAVKRSGSFNNNRACSFVAPSFSKSSMTSRNFNSSKQLSGASGSEILSSFGQDFEGKDVASAMEALANADAVCFDVDSTVIQEEGIVSYLYFFRNSMK